MFFIGIFGISQKEKDFGRVETRCKSCNLQFLRIVKSYSYFHFFFLPVFKWNVQYYAICDSCHIVYGISNDKGEAIEKGYKEVLSYWDLKEASSYHSHENRCPSCHREVEGDFQFCPYCGERLR